jgi:hypothetical protein
VPTARGNASGDVRSRASSAAHGSISAFVDRVVALLSLTSRGLRSRERGREVADADVRAAAGTAGIGGRWLRARQVFDVASSFRARVLAARRKDTKVSVCVGLVRDNEEGLVPGGDVAWAETPCSILGACHPCPCPRQKKIAS